MKNIISLTFLCFFIGCSTWNKDNEETQFLNELIIEENSKNIVANSFNLEIKKILSIEGKIAFIINNTDKFDPKNLEIYTQTGNLIKNLKTEKLDLPEHFTLQRNGGVKTIISFEGKRIALMSSSEKDCFFASLILIEAKQELFRTKCLPELAKNNDFNGLGSSNVHLENKILFTL